MSCTSIIVFLILHQEEIKNESKEIVSTIQSFDENLKSCTEASKKGVSK